MNYVLDAHGILYQNFHALPPMSSPHGEPVGALYGFARDLLTLLHREKPDRLFCAFDMPGETFRHRLYAEYKANRKAMPDDLRPQIAFAREFLDSCGVVPLGREGFEADDLMATLARLSEERGEECVLVTADKDCRQLISKRVTLFNLRKQQRYSFEELRGDWGIGPEQVVDFQAMVGDPTDNIPGIPLIGPKLATQLLEQFGTLEGVLANVEAVSGAKRKENIRAAAESVMLSRRLVELDRRVPLDIDWEASRFQGVDAGGLGRFLHRFGFKSLQEKIDPLPQRAGTPFREIVESAPPSSGLSSVDARYRLIDTPELFEAFLARLNAQKIFAFDTETVPLTPAFEATMPRYTRLVGLSFCWEENEAYYLPVRGPLGAQTLDPETVLEKLRPVFENPDIGKVGQNLKYDRIVLRCAATAKGKGIELRGRMFDTMLADYLLHAGYRTHNLDDLAEYYLEHKTVKITELIGSGKKQKRMDEVPTEVVCDYAGEDALIVWRLYAILQGLLEAVEEKPEDEGNLVQPLVRLNETLELPLVDVLVDLEYTGIAIDTAKLKGLSGRFEKTLRNLEEEIHTLAGHEFNIASPQQLQRVLFDELKLPVVKKTPKSGPSTDVEVLAELAALHPLPEKIREHRQIAKLKGTYVDALPLLIHPETGRIHASFNQVVTATGRLSSSNPNLQNIPVKSEQGREIREAFVPGKGFDTILACDYSQIELRVLAHYCDDANLRGAFERDEDIHAAVAAEVFDVPIASVSSEMRRKAKAVNFGVIYGQTAFGLSKALKISREEATAFIAAYFQKYPGINTFIDETLARCFECAYVETIAGRRREIEGVRPVRKGDLSGAERMAINTVIQGSAADLMKQAMVDVHAALKKSRLKSNMLLQIHDELVFETMADELPALRELVLREMTLGEPLRVPLKIDTETGPSWA